MLSRKKQQGITFIGFLSGLTLFAVILLIGMRIVPIYLESFSIRSTIVSLNDVKNVTIHSEKDIRQLLERRFNINNVTAIKPSDVEIKRIGENKYLVSVAYSISSPIIGNLSVSANFNESTEITR